jgi:hypothetical protein
MINKEVMDYQQYLSLKACLLIFTRLVIVPIMLVWLIAFFSVASGISPGKLILSVIILGLLKKSKSIKRKVRKGITQRSQSIKYQYFSLRPLRKALASLAVKKDFFKIPSNIKLAKEPGADDHLAAGNVFVSTIISLCSVQFPGYIYFAILFVTLCGPKEPAV